MKRPLGIALLILAVVLFNNCSGGGGGNAGQQSAPGLTIYIADTRETKAFPPELAYLIIQIYAEGSMEAETQINYPQSSVVFSELSPGNKDIYVGGYDSSENIIAYGEATATVAEGYNNSVEVLLSYAPPLWAALFVRNTYSQDYYANPQYNMSVSAMVTAPVPLPQADYTLTFPNQESQDLVEQGGGGQNTVLNYSYGYPPTMVGYAQIEGRGTGSFLSTERSLPLNQLQGNYDFNLNGDLCRITYNHSYPDLPVVLTPTPQDTLDFGEDITVEWQDLGSDYCYLIQAYTTNQQGVRSYLWSSNDTRALNPNNWSNFPQLLDELTSSNSVVIPAGTLPSASWDVHLSVLAFNKSWTQVQNLKQRENPFLEIGKMVAVMSEYQIMLNPVHPMPRLPFISSINPNLGGVGDQVTLQGGRFGETQGNSSVTFNRIDAGVALCWFDTEIVVEVPEGAQSGQVLAMVNLLLSNPVLFTVDERAARWLWANPTPVPYYLNAVWGDSPRGVIADVFAVGDHGTILHWDGFSWEVMVSPVNTELTDVFGFAANDVYAVGMANTILHYDGTSWQPVADFPQPAPFDLLAVWGTSGNDLYVGAMPARIYHYDGSNWTFDDFGGGAIKGIFGLAANDIYAVGDGGTILHYNGVQWLPNNSGTFENLYGIWAENATNIWAVGDNGTILYSYGGGFWESQFSGSAENLRSVWGSGGLTYVAGENGTLLNNGEGWNPVLVETVEHLYGVWTGSDLFCVGANGTIVQWDELEQVWSYYPQYLDNNIDPLYAVWQSPNPETFVVGSAGRVIKYDGFSWYDLSIDTASDLYGVWGTAANDVYTVGALGDIFQYDGESWNLMNSTTGEDLWDIFGFNSNDIFVVGDLGIILHYDGNNWTTQNSGTNENLYGVWGSAHNNVYAVGEVGTILNYDGFSWSPVNSGTNNVLNDIWGSSANDIFVVGNQGTVVHYDGSWNYTPLEFSEDLYSVSGLSADNVFVCGTNGAVLYYDGNSWNIWSFACPYNLYGIRMVDQDKAWAVGDNATILLYEKPAQE